MALGGGTILVLTSPPVEGLDSRSPSTGSGRTEYLNDANTKGRQDVFSWTNRIGNTSEIFHRRDIAGHRFDDKIQPVFHLLMQQQHETQHEQLPELDRVIKPGNFKIMSIMRKFNKS